ncbi:dihydrofolate reductase family protein [Nocardioides gilvus]|uniref:dihydrofolate reductase family protein n=1 Tax=Nocardioides gilvus TaxID=1735589 RepID=UPI000D74A76B|nr:dihydrofolate reductase family protein [Nocardioides gilvus]
MRQVTYSMNTSLDGYIEGPDGGIAWSVPDDEVFATHLAEIRGVGVHLLGRPLYETMLYWEDADEDRDLSEAEREWRTLWMALPKVVFSRTLSEVRGENTRLASGTLDEEIAQLRSEPGDGDIAIGGATLAAQVAALDLIDEYRLMIHPVLVGGGRPYFAQAGRQVGLELVGTRTFDSGVVQLRHRVRH